MRFCRQHTTKYELRKGRKSPACLAVTARRMTAESCLDHPFGGVLIKQMPSQDSQGRKLLHIVSIVANLPVTDTEGHYHVVKAPENLPPYPAITMPSKRLA